MLYRKKGTAKDEAEEKEAGRRRRWRKEAMQRRVRREGRQINSNPSSSPSFSVFQSPFASSPSLVWWC